MYFGLWWEQHDERRQMSALSEVPQIYVLSIEDGGKEEERV